MSPVRYQILADFPNMGKLYEDFAPELRGFSMGNYIIFYWPIENGIEAIRVLSGYYDFEALFSQLEDSE